MARAGKHIFNKVIFFPGQSADTFASALLCSVLLYSLPLDVTEMRPCYDASLIGDQILYVDGSALLAVYNYVKKEGATSP